MKFFTVYTNPNIPQTIKFIPNGFSWFIFIFGAIGLCLQKSWIHGLIILSICLSLLFWFNISIIGLMIIHFLLACWARSFQQRELTLSGWKLQTVIAAKNKDIAFLRLLDKYPELTRR